MIAFRHRLRRSIDKTVPDLARLLSGRAPAFVYGGEVSGLPAFTYHVVDERFEGDLEHLRRGGYRTVGVEELDAWQRGRFDPQGKCVALTFDDGHESLIRIAVPALRRHGFRALAFVVSGLVPDRTEGRLAGWDALRDACADGTLEVGAHSRFHHHVPLAPRPIGFVDPDTDLRFEANIPVPRVRGDDPVPLGTPFLRGAPRYTAPRAFLPDPEAWERVLEPVRDEGEAFFLDPRWARRLRERASGLTGRMESADEADAAAIEDMRRSMEIVEERCPNPGARQLCYPWYAGDTRTDRLARAAGVARAFLGVDRRDAPRGDDGPDRIGRLPEEWLPMLPGPGRTSLRRRLGARLRGLARGPVG